MNLRISYPSHPVIILLNTDDSASLHNNKNHLQCSLCYFEPNSKVRLLVVHIAGSIICLIIYVECSDITILVLCLRSVGDPRVELAVMSSASRRNLVFLTRWRWYREENSKTCFVCWSWGCGQRLLISLRLLILTCYSQSFQKINNHQNFLQLDFIKSIRNIYHFSF